MASTADLIRGGAASIASGKQVDSNSVGAAVGSPEVTSESTGVTVDEGEFTTAGESTTDDLLPGEDTPKDSAEGDKGPASSEQKQTSENREVITVTDEHGRRKKLEIDYSDRKATRKAHEMAVGARKWQAERDQARQQLQKEMHEKSELRTNWEALEKTFQEKGLEGIVDLIEGRPGAFKQLEKKIIDRARFLDNASPEEIQALEAKERAELSNKELQRIRKENEDFRKEMAAEKETAELRSLESRVHPVFDKYRFADKLGDANDEHMFDEMLWNSALKRLEPYEEQGLSITPELVDREFRNVAMAIRKRIGLQAEKKAAKVVEQKKQEATENVQAAVKSGYSSGNKNAQEARDLINNGNLTSLLKGWSKYGSLFNK